MQVKDIVNNEEMELSREDLIAKMKEGRVLSEFTSHNIHDLNAYFFPDEAAAVQLS